MSPAGEEECKGASVVFPWNDADWPSAPEVAVVEVGGEDSEDQRARLRFLAEAIREADRLKKC